MSDSNKELIEEYAERVAALQDELNTAQAGAEEALQLCATEQVIVTYISCRFPVFKGYHCMMVSVIINFAGKYAIGNCFNSS